MLTKQPKGATENRKKSSGWLNLFWMFIGAILAVMVGVFAYLSPLFNFAKQNTANTNADYQIQPKVNTKDDTNYEFYDVLPNQNIITIPETPVIETSNPNLSETSSSTFKPDVVVEQQKRLEEAAKRQLQEQAAEQDSQPNQNDDYGISEEIILNPEDPSYNEPTDEESDIFASNTANTNNKKPSINIQHSQPATTYILQINSFGSADEADQRRAQVLMAGVDAKVVKSVTGNGHEIYQVISVATPNRNAIVLQQQRLQKNGIDSIIVEQRRR